MGELFFQFYFFQLYPREKKKFLYFEKKARKKKGNAAAKGFGDDPAANGRTVGSRRSRLLSACILSMSEKREGEHCGERLRRRAGCFPPTCWLLFFLCSKIQLPQWSKGNYSYFPCSKVVVPTWEKVTLFGLVPTWEIVTPFRTRTHVGESYLFGLSHFSREKKGNRCDEGCRP